MNLPHSYLSFSLGILPLKLNMKPASVVYPSSSSSGNVSLKQHTALSVVRVRQIADQEHSLSRMGCTLKIAFIAVNVTISKWDAIVPTL